MSMQVAFTDTVEQIGAPDFEQLANISNYHWVSGCAASYSAVNLEVTVAAGVVFINGANVATAGATLTLAPSGTTPRWAIISVASDGTTKITHGTAAAVPAKPDIGNEVMIHAVKIQGDLTAANAATARLDKRAATAYAVNKFNESVNTVAAAGTTETIDLAVTTVHDITLDENVTFTFSNPAASGRATSFTLILRQDGTGTNTVTWPASVDWAGGSAPTITAGANAVDIFTFFTVDGGVTWFGFVGGQAFA